MWPVRGTLPGPHRELVAEPEPEAKSTDPQLHALPLPH